MASCSDLRLRQDNKRELYVVPACTNRRFGDRAFSVAAAKACNSPGADPHLLDPPLEQSTHRPEDRSAVCSTDAFKRRLAFQKDLGLTFGPVLLQLCHQRFIIVIIILCHAQSVLTCIVEGASQMTVYIYIYVLYTAPLVSKVLSKAFMQGGTC